MMSLYRVLDMALQLYTMCVVAWVVMSWLVAFDVVNPRQTFVRMLGRFLSAVVEPVLAPIRRVIPLVGGIDLSPLVLFFAIYLVQSLMREYWGTMFY
jgi:YggT family protein